MRFLYLLIPIFLFAGCTEKADQPTESTPDKSAKRFALLSVEQSGIGFTNSINETPRLNYYMYEYLYNGGGVALGDINNDGLTDIYLTGNVVRDKLYLNNGNLDFEEITESALASGHDGWHSGVTMVDINNDNLLDIYVCRAGWYEDPTQRSNLLYINNGDNSFIESAQQFGLADTSRSTQAAFFDYDGDGDLDAYVMNAPLQKKHKLNTKQVEAMIQNGTSPSDRLFRNDDGLFVDVSMEAGIQNYAYGLGLSISDLNGDGLPDIYVSNDYIAPDFMYINNGDGTFTDELKTMTRHISNYGMGTDVADFNNDGLVDIMQLDMVSEDHVRSKKNMSGMAPDKFWGAVAVGYHYQFMTNTLQLNNGNGTFSEIAQMAGVAKTDWSWAPLFADLDNDGLKDLFITNGYKRDMRDNDYLKELERLNSGSEQPSFDQVMALIPAHKIRNYLYHNQGDLSFQNVSRDWGLERAYNSNGAAYADLDNDGDLDLVVNNIDEPSAIYRNNNDEFENNKSLRIKFNNKTGALAYGAQVRIVSNGQEQLQEFQPTRGYQSAVEPILHFGIGTNEKVESVSILWPDGMKNSWNDVPAGELEVHREGVKQAIPKKEKEQLFTRNVGAFGVDFVHLEDPYDDFAREVLLPHKQSEFGPFFSQGDVNGDGLNDLFVGGAIGQGGKLYIQLTEGQFMEAVVQPWIKHANQEDIGSVFFDADSDGDQDLYIVSGSNQYDLKNPNLLDRLYLNNGSGTFQYAAGAIPNDILVSGGTVVAGDIDGDGDEDLFVAGRTSPANYPFPAQSFLLENSGGSFFNITEARAAHLQRPGMITDAEFVDIDADGDLDLVTVGEWMGVQVHLNSGGGFSEASAQWGLKGTEGWWYSVACEDIDSDGDMDIVAGNIGWNSKFHGTPEHPTHIYFNDFDGNGTFDIVLAKEKDHKLLPVRGRECSSEQVPDIKSRFQNYDQFAHASLEDIYTAQKLNDGLHLQAVNMKSSVFLNDGGKFVQKPLPNIAQAAPINGVIVQDINNDGHKDLIVAGNMFGAEVETIRYDGGTGLVLLGDGTGNFEAMSIPESGFFANGNVKDICWVKTPDGPILFVGTNNGPVMGFKLNSTTVLSVK